MYKAHWQTASHRARKPIPATDQRVITLLQHFSHVIELLQKEQFTCYKPLTKTQKCYPALAEITSQPARTTIKIYSAKYDFSGLKIVLDTIKAELWDNNLYGNNLFDVLPPTHEVLQEYLRVQRFFNTATPTIDPTDASTQPDPSLVEEEDPPSVDTVGAAVITNYAETDDNFQFQDSCYISLQPEYAIDGSNYFNFYS